MKIEDFAVEIWMNEYENTCAYNLAETCVASLSVEELLELSGERDEVLAEMLATRLSYGDIPGSDRLRTVVASLYDNQNLDNVLITHGTAGANALVHETLVEPGDRVVTVRPTYQQHYSIPESYGADLQELWLTDDAGWLPDLDALAALATPGTKLIVLTNPNNPTGSLMPVETLQAIADIARQCGAWILCDEVYRGIDQTGTGTTTSIADVYERGISTGGMSKPFALAGLRLGWVVGPSDFLEAVSIHRDYNTISVGRIDDLMASVALENVDKILDRSRQITRANLAVVDAWVKGRTDVDWVTPVAATVGLVRYTAEVDSYELCKSMLAETGVMVTPGDAFGIPRSIRIGFAYDTDTIKLGLDLMGSYLDGLG